MGDPTQDMVVSFDKDMNAVATGHYQMTFAFQESGVHGVQHSPGSGGYRAALALTPDAVTAASIQPADGLPALARPAGASDQAAKDLVAQAFKRCAAVRAQYVADCPQALLSLATNVRWALVGNPLSGASVNFDQNSGQFTVHGNFAMNVSYSFLGYPEDRQQLQHHLRRLPVLEWQEPAAGHHRWSQLELKSTKRSLTDQGGALWASTGALNWG